MELTEEETTILKAFAAYLKHNSFFSSEEVRVLRSFAQHMRLEGFGGWAR